jgi:hypothetical protein
MTRLETFWLVLFMISLNTFLSASLMNVTDLPGLV